MSGGKFEIPLNISNHPCSWGVDYADCPTNPPWEKVIKCIADSGYAGSELGPVGYYDPEKLGEKLESLKLQLVAGNIFEKLHEPAEVKAIIEKVHTSCRTLKKFGAKYFVIVPHVCEEKIATAGRSADAPRLPKEQWDSFMEAIKQVAEVTKSYGIQCTLHPHAGCWIEYEDEIERALADLPADLVGLCLDTGHFTYAGMDPVAKYKKYASRVPYMHFKDIDGAVLAKLQKEKGGFWDGIKSGVFCPLGKGLVDFPAVLRAMKECGFSGWVTVEQDADNSISDEEARLMKPFECCKLNVEYLRSLGVVSPQQTGPGASYMGRFDGSESKHASPAMAALSGKGGAAAETDPSSLPTSTKWSVLSSRVEGLVAELAQVVGKQDAYCVSQSKCEGPAMEAVREKMLATPWAKEWAERRTMFSYGEEMSTDPLEAMLLKQLTFMCAPRRVMEIGMFVGYGSVAMLEGSSSCQVVSLEIDPYLKGWLSSCLSDAGLSHLSKRHEVVVGPALESLPKLTGEFDLVFVDANKAEYKRYVELILEHKLLSPSGMIICDNILYNGYPYVHSHFDSQPARRGFGDAIKEFNQWVCDHPCLEQVVLPVRDGISLIRQRGTACGTKAAATGGNLVQYDDTWHILKEGETAPANALASDCRIDASASEYAAQTDADGPRAWMSKSMISFDYRVVEVPRGKLLDPACDALIFGHLPFGSPEREAAAARPQRRLIVIDETVDSLYGEKVRAYFEARGVAHEILRLPLVEENKSVEMTLKVCEKMKKFNIDRRTEPVIAIGGGVCLDVVGLAASLFRRRTPYIRVPTTALAYVDASVGAKNGCNFLGSKNRLGTYVPPVAALLDSSFFKSQQRREVSNSLGEMAKMAIMKSEELFHLLEKNGRRLIEDRFEPRDASDGVPARVLRLSIQTMLEELAPNLWEHSLDRLVDFGHAVGQNLEMSALGTEDELMHGEAVACDMAFMSVLSNILGLISAPERDAILNMLRSCEVPVYSPRLTREFFKEAMADRVQNSMGQRLPMPVGIGKARMVNDVSDADFEKAFVQWEALCKK